MAEQIKKNDVFQTLAGLRQKYPDSDDISRIDRESDRVKKLLAQKAFYAQETTQELIALCRNDILVARKKLASDRSLIGDEKTQRELWYLIDSRKWFLDMVSENVGEELESLERELETELNS